ncbi:MAG: hypothetical protein H7346_04195 [Burkholderiaceae bacterium]|nr:hypothetical protein [Burkholderiaceae bacterium]
MLRFIKILLLTASTSIALLHGAAHAQGVAMAVDRTGDVDVTAAGKTLRLNVLDYLPPDAEVRLAAGAAATLVYLASSQEWQFTGPGRYQLKAGQPAVLQGAAPKARGVPAPSAQAMAKMEPAQRERMALGAIVMRASGPLRIVSPNDMDLLDARPTLLWQAADGQPVRITVIDSNKAAAVQTVTTANQWTVSAALPAGDYIWRAEIVSDTPTAPRNSRFKIISADDPRRARIVPATDGFGRRVARAMMLENEDLPHDALLMWRQLAAERPEEESLKQWAR